MNPGIRVQWFNPDLDDVIRVSVNGGVIAGETGTSDEASFFPATTGGC